MNSHSSFPIIHPPRVYFHLFHQVQRDAVYDAFYKLTNSYTQISSYIFDVVRASVPKMNLDDVFEAKEEIAHTIKEELTKSMTGYGFLILHALVTDIEPAHKVKEVSLDQISDPCGVNRYPSSQVICLCPCCVALDHLPFPSASCAPFLLITRTLGSCISCFILHANCHASILNSNYLQAMNEINAARRLRVAAAETAEAHKVSIGCSQRLHSMGED